MKTSNAKSYTQLLIQAFWLKLDFPLRSSNQALGGEEEQQRATAAASSSPSQMGFFLSKKLSLLGNINGVLCRDESWLPVFEWRGPASRSREAAPGEDQAAADVTLLCEAATCWRLSRISLSALDHDSLAFCSPHFCCYANSAEDKSLTVNRVAVKSD